MLPNEPKKENGFFDATVTTEEDKTTENSSETELAKAKLRADHQNMVAKFLVDDIIAQKKKSFRRTVVLSVGSVVLLLILAIVFCVYLHWYGAGAGVAILAFGVAQLWLRYFKKWDKSNPDFDEMIEADDYERTQENNSSNGSAPAEQQCEDKSKERTEENQDAGI